MGFVESRDFRIVINFSPFIFESLNDGFIQTMRFAAGNGGVLHSNYWHREEGKRYLTFGERQDSLTNAALSFPREESSVIMRSTW